MPTITPAAFRKQIAAGRLDAVYLIVGDDEAEKIELAHEIEAAIEEDLRPFNVERFHGADAGAPPRPTLGRILDSARTLPMLAPRRIVIVIQAEKFLAPKRESDALEREVEAFEAYLDDPRPEATIALVLGGALDERRRSTKHLLSSATIVRCGSLEDVHDAERWVRSRLTAAGLRVDPAAVRLVAELAGPDITRLRGDVERLQLYAAEQGTIGVADVREVVGPAAAHDDWAVTDAITRGQVGPALRELGLMLDAGAPPLKVLGQLAWFVRSRLPPARVRAAAEALLRTDLGLKSSAGDARILLERLVVELCEERR